jgi:tetratricopeptide (TPR) repeat protein
VRACAAGLLLLAAWGCQNGPPPRLVEQGDVAFVAGDYVSADALYAQAVAQGGADVGPALLGRARVALAVREPERALRMHRRLARTDRPYWLAHARDDYATALSAAGRERLRSGHAGDAVEAFRTLAAVDPAWPELERWLSRSLTRHAAGLAMHGRREEALALYREAVEADPGAVEACVGAAEILIGTGRRDEALAVLEVARRADPGDGRVRALTMEAMGLY